MTGVSDETASAPERCTKTRLEPGQWLKVEFYGWCSRGGTVKDATIWSYADLDAAEKAAGDAFRFSHVAGMRFTPGPVHEPGFGPDGKLGASIPVPRRMPDGRWPEDGEQAPCSCGCPG